MNFSPAVQPPAPLPQIHSAVQPPAPLPQIHSAAQPPAPLPQIHSAAPVSNPRGEQAPSAQPPAAKCARRNSRLPAPLQRPNPVQQAALLLSGTRNRFLRLGAAREARSMPAAILQRLLNSIVPTNFARRQGA